jgi:hypothetical protein
MKHRPRRRGLDPAADPTAITPTNSISINALARAGAAAARSIRAVKMLLGNRLVERT